MLLFKPPRSMSRKIQFSMLSLEIANLNTAAETETGSFSNWTELDQLLVKIGSLPYVDMKIDLLNEIQEVYSTLKILCHEEHQQHIDKQLDSIRQTLESLHIPEDHSQEHFHAAAGFSY